MAERTARTHAQVQRLAQRDAAAIARLRSALHDEPVSLGDRPSDVHDIPGLVALYEELFEGDDSLIAPGRGDRQWMGSRLAGFSTHSRNRRGMSRSVAFACTLAVGGLIALQPPANAALARHVGDLGAALISAVITVTILAVLLLVFSAPSRLSGLAGFRPQYAIGGIGGAAVVAVSLVAVRPLGVAGVVSLLVAGQLVISVLADRLEWFGVARVGLTPARLAGVLLVAVGTLLITRP